MATKKNIDYTTSRNCMWGMYHALYSLLGAEACEPMHDGSPWVRRYFPKYWNFDGRE